MLHLLLLLTPVLADPNIFFNFLSRYNRTYPSVTEYVRRYDVFQNNLAYINQHNSRANADYSLSINKWTDLTFDEFIQQRRGLAPRVYSTSTPDIDYNILLPTAVDWRIVGAVNPIKNQEQCGDCWAFSAIAAIEGAYALLTKKSSGKAILLDLSEQQLTDCSDAQGNLGCNGGLMTNAFTYAKDNALCSEASYPFKGVDDTCKTCKGLIKVQDYVNVPSGNETALEAAVALGVVSVAIEADTMDFQFYSSGVFKSSGCGTQLDHGVALVGYGIDSTAGKYWILRNSWSTSWGEKGYMKLARGNNECGVALSASYPIVGGSAPQALRR